MRVLFDRRRRLFDVDLSALYLTFEALESGTFLFTKACEYSLDNGLTWTSLAAETDSPILSTGNKIMWRANITPSATSGSEGIGTFSSTGNYNALGNPLSLILQDSFRGIKILPNYTYTFYRLFHNNDKLINAENLSLPCTTLRGHCYRHMFLNCTNLLTTPELPALSVPTYAYNSMFNGCSSLVISPVLKATSLGTYCYSGMFAHCTSLTQAPILGATTLAEACYYQMFYDCTALTTTPTLPSITIANYCYKLMFQGCTALVNVTNLPATGTLKIGCYYSMFRDCTSLVTAPYISATTANGYTLETVSSMAYMFYGCTSLKNVPRMPNGHLTNSHSFYYTFGNCTSLEEMPSFTIYTTRASDAYGMFYCCSSLKSAANITIAGTSILASSLRSTFEGCTSLTTPPTTIPGTTYYANACQRMFYGCTKLTSTPIMTIEPRNNYSCSEMFLNCSSLTTINLTFTGTNVGGYGCQYMFSGCTSLVTAPALPLTTRNASSNVREFYYMFNGCTSLKTPPPSLNLTSTGTYTYGYMFQGCTSLEKTPSITTHQFGQYCCRYMFSGCTSLTSISGNMNVTSMSTYAFLYMFNNCSSLLSSANISINVSTMPQEGCSGMFLDCSSMTTTMEQLPATTLGSACYIYMYRRCTSLTKSPELPAPTLVTNCYYQMFDGCTHLNYIKCLATNISASGCLTTWVRNVSSTGTFVKDTNMNSWPRSVNGIPTGWTVINDMILSANYYSGDDVYLWDVSYIGLTSRDVVSDIRINNVSIDLDELDNNEGMISNISEDDDVDFYLVITTIVDDLFASTMITNVTIPKGVTSIGENAFEQCGYLSNITIPNTITSIGNIAFSLCEALTIVDLPDSITSIGDYAFEYCTSLSELYVRSTVPPTLGSDVFDHTPSGFRIFVPYESLNTYKTAPGWSDYASSIEEISEFE